MDWLRDYFVSNFILIFLSLVMLIIAIQRFRQHTKISLYTIIVVAASKAANDKGYLAGKLVKDIATLLGGSGGGRPDLASGAGKDLSRLEEVNKLLD